MPYSVLKSKFFSEWSEPKIYYNNFEISSLSLWTSAEYKLFIDFIDDTGGIFYERWGDAPIKGIAVSILIDRNETFHFHDLAYRHGNFFTNSTFSSF
jgi:Glycolipid 2-alpha-mannosyltransferase